MQIEKESISMEPLSFARIEDYLAHIKELQLKLGECGKDFLNKDGQLIELVKMNLKTPMSYVLLFGIIGCHIRKMVRDSPLVPSMIY